jgi:hypothetical protein
MTAKVCHTIMWLLVAAVFLYAVGTLPDAAHGAPAPQQQQQQPRSHVNPDGTAVLYIYPHDELREDDEIIKDPRATPAPEDAVTGDPFIDVKDPRTWA